MCASSQSRQWQPQLAYRFATPRRHFIPLSTPSRGHDPDVAADCPRLSNPHSSIAPRRSTHAGPRFPPSRLFGRLPPCIPSRLRLAGIRKPLTIPVVPATATKPPGLTRSRGAALRRTARTSAACPIRGGAGATVRLDHPLFEHNGNLPQITVQIFSQCSISNSHNYE